MHCPIYLTQVDRYLWLTLKHGMYMICRCQRAYTSEYKLRFTDDGLTKRLTHTYIYLLTLIWYFLTSWHFIISNFINIWRKYKILLQTIFVGIQFRSLWQFLIRCSKLYFFFFLPWPLIHMLINNGPKTLDSSWYQFMYIV